MEPGKGKWNEKMVLHLDANRVEFVATNGHDWDSPQPQNEGDRPNYWADVCVFWGGGGVRRGGVCGGSFACEGKRGQ